MRHRLARASLIGDMRGQLPNFPVRASIPACKKKGDSPGMSDTRVDFSAPATLRKWPSVNNERVSASLSARPYMIIEGTLDECIRKFMLQPKSQRYLYEIHTVPKSDVVGAILSTEHVVELARLRDFLGK
jgi:hypothetical protein